MSLFRHAFRFIFVLTLVFFAPAQIRSSDANGPETLPGETLMQYCAGKYDTDMGICAGYVMAVAEAMIYGQNAFGQRACGHDGIKGQQLVDLVRLEVGEHPELKKQSAGVMVASVIALSFPCYEAYEPAAGDIEIEMLP